MIIKRCECCGKKIEVNANRRLCSSCGNYNLSLRQQISSLKHELRNLKIKIYGAIDRRMPKFKSK